ncbi:AfsR/SARP family transcriptional regulator [Nocardia sp. NPDC052566]|uniref:AfsR/SARP family transcriptional regulator n=1 Tax=Nocardia sp. NPDC052566 TaxID=3364330 RepID=UPI0037C93297
MGVRFTVLGPTEVLVDGRALAAAPRHRAVLAYLLINAGRAVSTERLIEAMWGMEPPDTARSQIHAAVTAIRRVLRAAEVPHVLETMPAGYIARPDPDHLDLDEFTRRVTASQALAGADPAAAVAELRAALRLWRGEALAGLSADYVESVRRRLREKRLTAFERLAELGLALGEHDRLLDELTAQAAANPLREKLAGQLMLALHRAGRQVDALAAARTFRMTLADQQGLDPGRDFVALEQAILRDEPEQPSKAAPVAARPAVRRASFLPYDIPDFAGRDAELDRLLAPQAATSATIFTIDGMAGIGKTALAIRAAHRVADRCPDGQLFIDLQAHAAGLAPITPDAALEILLRQLGIPAELIPAATAERGALWRAELAERRVVVVLDNAADADHVRALLPGPGASLILITSRRRLVDLDGARTLSVDLLPARDGVALFERTVGARAVDEPLAVLDVLQLCGFLPLAVRIAAAKLLHRPRWTVEYLARRLRDERRRLAELATAERGVAAAFTLSYRQLPLEDQRMFRLLGLHPGPDIDPGAAAALADTTIDDAELVLESLLDAHVIAQHEPGRYTFHDLLREHARATVAAEESEDERAAALARLYTHYLHSARAAVDLLFPHSAGHRQPLPPAAVAVNTATDSNAAARWLDDECENLLATAAYAAEHGAPEHGRDTSDTLRPYLDGYARHTAAARLHRIALVASRQLADPIGESRARTELGWVNWRLGDYERADTHSREALRLARAAGDRYQEARALNTLGKVAWRRRDYDAAHDHLLAALDLVHTAGNRVGEAHVLGNLGAVLSDDGQFAAARAHLDQALLLHREVGNERGEALVLNYLGALCRRMGLLDKAREQHCSARDLYRTLGNGSEASALNGLGETARAAGDPAEAVEHHRAALDLIGDTGDEATGTVDKPIDLLERACANEGLARAHHDLGDRERARTCAEIALKLYAGLGIPEADDLRVFLDAL